MHGIDPAQMGFLDIRVRRENLLADALQQIVMRPSSDLKKPLRVTFVSAGVPEEGLDQGGVTKVAAYAFGAVAHVPLPSSQPALHCTGALLQCPKNPLPQRHLVPTRPGSKMLKKLLLTAPERMHLDAGILSAADSGGFQRGKSMQFP